MRLDVARQPPSADATLLLDELKEAHEALIYAIAALRQLTDGPAPPKDVLVTARWNISRASLCRRLLWGRIHAHLSDRIDAERRDALHLLQQEDSRLLRYSTQHIRKWTADAILKDWQGYCQASELMQRRMMDAITTEKRILYPVLEMHRSQ